MRLNVIVYTLIREVGQYFLDVEKKYYKYRMKGFYFELYFLALLINLLTAPIDLSKQKLRFENY